jgi:MraZ protein
VEGLHFSGWFEHAIDSKGRVSVPSTFRETVQETGDDRLFATQSLSAPCIEVYPAVVWQELLKRLAALPQSDKRVIRYRRLFVSSAQLMSIDKAGRVLIPASLRSRLNLDKDVMFAGNVDKMEIWDRAAFEAYASEEDPQDVLAGMAELGF